MLNDLLYAQGDKAQDIYFINEGKIKFVCDLNEMIQNEQLEICIDDYKKMLYSISTEMNE